MREQPPLSAIPPARSSQTGAIDLERRRVAHGRTTGRSCLGPPTQGQRHPRRVLPWGRGVDPERPGRLETESWVVRRVAHKHDHGLSGRIGGVEQGTHHRRRDAHSLKAGQDGDRPERHDGQPIVQPAARPETVPNDPRVHRGDERQPSDRVCTAADRVDDPALEGATECGVMNGTDRPLIVRLLGPDDRDRCRGRLGHRLSALSACPAGRRRSADRRSRRTSPHPRSPGPPRGTRPRLCVPTCHQH